MAHWPGSTVERSSEGSEQGDDRRGRACLHILRGRRDDLRGVLHGRPLQVLVEWTDTPAVLRLLLTADGHVLDLPEDQQFSPDAELRGSAARIHAFLAGAISLFDAVVTRLLTLHISSDTVRKYDDLRTLLAEALVDPEDS